LWHAKRALGRGRSRVLLRVNLEKKSKGGSNFQAAPLMWRAGDGKRGKIKSLEVIGEMVSSKHNTNE